MCGICFVISRSSYELSELEKEHLLRRGPDQIYENRIQLAPKCWLNFFASVLYMRGSPTPQPLVDGSGNVLCYNGNIWNGIKLDETENDTVALSKCFESCKSEDDFLSVITSIQGPFALIYYQIYQKVLWFGRDVFGRRSLLFATDGEDWLYLGSLSHVDKVLMWHEIPSGIIFKLDLGEASGSFVDKLCAFCIRDPEVELLTAMQNELKLNIHRIFHPSNLQRIKSGLFTLNKQLPPPVIEDYYVKNKSCDQALNLKNVLSAESTKKLVMDFLDVLNEAVRLRISGKKLCENCLDVRSCVSHSKVAVLFSGGIDSLLLAASVHLMLPESEPIDLLNVSFGQGSIQNGRSESLVPDRVTGIKAFEMLKRLYPKRSWIFVTIDVSKEELVKCRQQRISRLIAPACTVLDDSLGCVLWFAARGVGIDFDTGKNYRSPAKILILGTGADEIFGGYSRHRGRFNKAGWSGLVDELEMELGRISNRNLGRDDRIVSDHGRESRLPFLDENLVKFCNKLETWKKMNLNWPRGLGEKLLLRLSLWHLGFEHLALTLKRAMQFGTRIAKLENSKEKADQVCDRLIQCD